MHVLPWAPLLVIIFTKQWSDRTGRERLESPHDFLFAPRHTSTVTSVTSVSRWVYLSRALMNVHVATQWMYTSLLPVNDLDKCEYMQSSRTLAPCCPTLQMFEASNRWLVDEVSMPSVLHCFRKNYAPVESSFSWLQFSYRPIQRFFRVHFDDFETSSSHGYIYFSTYLNGAKSICRFFFCWKRYTAPLCTSWRWGVNSGMCPKTCILSLSPNVDLHEGGDLNFVVL